MKIFKNLFYKCFKKCYTNSIKRFIYMYKITRIGRMVEMKKIVRTLLIIIVIFVLSIVLFDLNLFKEDILVNEEGNEAIEAHSTITTDIQQENNLSFSTESIFFFMGKNVSELQAALGNPVRKEPSMYDYEWWIYLVDEQQYYQVGVLNDQVSTIFAIGESAKVAPFQIGEDVSEIYNKIPIVNDVVIENEFGTYRFELSEDQIFTKPLIPIDNYYAIVYIDRSTNSISSIRVMDEMTLLKMRPYELVYVGELMEPNLVTEDQLSLVSEGMNKQIFDLTNMYRLRYQLPTLQWDEKLANVAYMHSVDMKENDHFSHISLSNGELSDRLEKEKIPFLVAGENIAANYLDSIEVMEGWLNSKGHRESLLNEEFTHLGVGVYQSFYTQNFISQLDISANIGE